MHKDLNGLPVQSNGDGGDSLQRLGFWFEGIHFCMNVDLWPIFGTEAENYLTLLYKCEIAPATFIRNPTNYNDPKDTSRDQLVSNIRAAGYFAPEIAAAITTKCFQNWCRYPNGDLFFLQDFARSIRSAHLWWAYPWVVIGDVLLLGNSIVRIIKGKNPNDVGDDINHIGDLQQAKTIYPTPISWLARKVYKRLRPYGIKYPVQWYFRESSGADTEFIDLWVPIVEKF